MEYLFHRRRVNGLVNNVVSFFEVFHGFKERTDTDVPTADRTVDNDLLEETTTLFHPRSLAQGAFDIRHQSLVVLLQNHPFDESSSLNTAIQLERSCHVLAAATSLHTLEIAVGEECAHHVLDHVNGQIHVLHESHLLHLLLYYVFGRFFLLYLQFPTFGKLLFEVPHRADAAHAAQVEDAHGVS